MIRLIWKSKPESQSKKGGGGLLGGGGLRVRDQRPKNPVVPTKEEMERKYSGRRGTNGKRKVSNSDSYSTTTKRTWT